MSEVTEDPLAALRGLIHSEMIDLNTSIEGVIVSYSGGFASVRPIGSKRFQDGDSLAFPVIHKVPVRWPAFNGGTAGVKGPVTPGDKCILVFAQQAADGSDDLRRHDLSDAYAIMVDGAQVSQGVNNADMVMYFGAAYIRIGGSGEVEIVAPGGLTFTTPDTLNTGTFTTEGLFTFLAGMIGSTTSGISAVITGTINFIGQLTSNGKNISDSHYHTNSGGSGDGGPVA
jgi:phage baseplate assembly protein gpV